MEFGAFVELEPGVEGLIHISELSPTRVRRVADIVQPGQDVEVRILKVDPEVKKIALSLLPDPRKAALAADEEDDEEDETPPAPKPERKVPLKGGPGRSRAEELRGFRAVLAGRPRRERTAPVPRPVPSTPPAHRRRRPSAAPAAVGLGTPPRRGDSGVRLPRARYLSIRVCSERRAAGVSPLSGDQGEGEKTAG